MRALKHGVFDVTDSSQVSFFHLSNLSRKLNARAPTVQSACCFHFRRIDRHPNAATSSSNIQSVLIGGCVWVARGAHHVNRNPSSFMESRDLPCPEICPELGPLTRAQLKSIIHPAEVRVRMGSIWHESRGPKGQSVHLKAFPFSTVRHFPGHREIG